MVNQIIGQRLRLLRIHKHLKQTDLAEMLGYTQAAISAWEIGKRQIPTTQLLRLVEILKCELNDFDPKKKLTLPDAVEET